MMSIFRRKPMTGEDLIKQLKSFYESARKTFKEFEDRFDILAEIAKQAEKDSAEFRCQSCKGRPGNTAPRQTVLSREDDQRQIAELKQELTKKNAEVNELKERMSQQELLMDRKEKELRSIRSEKSKEADRVRVLDTKTKELTTENNRLKDRSKEMEETISCTRNENKRLLQENQQLRQKLRKRIVVNTHTTLNATLSGHALGELMSNLSIHLQTDNVNLDQRKYVSGTECVGPVVAICINVSRLGTDVQEVLKNIKKDQQDIAVLVLHHKEAHALPNQNSDRILTGSEYKKLGAIIDVAFLSSKGMYPCEMNSVAMGRLVSFLLQYKTDIL